MERALEWATHQYGAEWMVIGIVYELGTYLDLMDSACIQLVKLARKAFENDMNTIASHCPVTKTLNLIIKKIEY